MTIFDVYAPNDNRLKEKQSSKLYNELQKQIAEVDQMTHEWLLAS